MIDDVRTDVLQRVSLRSEVVPLTAQNSGLLRLLPTVELRETDRTSYPGSTGIRAIPSQAMGTPAFSAA
jgi:hypothetical protein